MIRQSIRTAAARAAGRAATAPAPHVLAAPYAVRRHDELLAALDTTPAGLDAEQIAARLHRDGANEVSHEKPPHWSRQLLHACRNPFIIVLLVLAGVQLATDRTDLTGPLIIGVMVAISVLLSFSQEYRSTRAAETLKAMVRNTATVSRRASDGHSERIEVPVAELVVGDIVHLGAGDMVPADLRLLSAKDLFISQAILTGESLPVEKAAPGAAVPAAAAVTSPLDLASICYLGTNVVSGIASAVVVATGPRSYLGSLAHSLVGQRVQTSFDRGVNSVSWLLIRFMAVMVPVVFLVNGIDKHDWLQAFLFALSVAVGLTPEMLPLIVTANLGKGALAMSRRKVVVKRLNAIQNFGAMDVLCTDKTGTLTLDKIVLERHLDLDGEPSAEALEYGYLNSRFQTGLKNLMDKAVLAHRELEPVAARYRIVDEVPFDFQRRRMSVVLAPLAAAPAAAAIDRSGAGRVPCDELDVSTATPSSDAGPRQIARRYLAGFAMAADAPAAPDDDDQHLLVCKGAVEEMLAICAYARQGDAEVPLTDARRRAIRATTRRLNEDGLRVLVVAVRRQPPSGRPYGLADETGLTAIGCLAFLDPPKDSAATAIAALRQHGGHFINHYGRFATEEIERWHGPEPNVPGLLRR